MASEKPDKPKRKNTGKKPIATKKAKLDTGPVVSGHDDAEAVGSDMDMDAVLSGVGSLASSSDAAGSGSDAEGCPETRPGSEAVAQPLGSERDSLAEPPLPPPSEAPPLSEVPSSDKSNDESGADSSSSSESSSSSTGSSSSSSSSRPQPDGSAAPKAIAKAKAKPTPKAKGPRVTDRSFYWGDHLITPVGPPGEEAKSYQIRCAKPSHNIERACTKKRAVTFGGADTVLLCLKYWASLGCQCDNATDHWAMWDSDVIPVWRSGTLPAEADLNSSVS